jgi:hypothetical protein
MLWRLSATLAMPCPASWGRIEQLNPAVSAALISARPAADCSRTFSIRSTNVRSSAAAGPSVLDLRSDGSNQRATASGKAPAASRDARPVKLGDRSRGCADRRRWGGSGGATRVASPSADANAQASAVLKAAARAPAVEYRASGSLAIAVVMTSSSDLGRSGRTGQGRRRIDKVRVEDGKLGLPRVGRLTGEAVEEDAAEREDVRAAVEWPALDLLGGRVGDGTEE